MACICNKQAIFLSIFNVEGFYRTMQTANISFKASPTKYIKELTPLAKPFAKIIELEETGADFAKSRLIQDTATNWFPKAIFSRSLSDFGEMSFQEILESLIVYFGPKYLGEKIYRPIYTKNLTKELQSKISTPATELVEKATQKDELRKLLPRKAAIAISTLAIPVGEYALSYLKNLFTLKVFNQADFNKIANLDKTKGEDKEKQNNVRKSAINHLKFSAGVLVGLLGISALLVKKGESSKILQKVSEAVLMPGNKLFPQSEKMAKGINEYFSIDFAKGESGKLASSKGQLVACVLAGFAGYAGSAKDRGKQNLLEVLFRFPLVGFYVITGSSLFAKGFQKILKKMNKCQDIIKEGNKIMNLDEITKKAANSAEFKKLFKQKAITTSVPFFFSMVVMGGFVAGCSRFFTQYRYNQDLKKQNSAKSFHTTTIEEFKNLITNNQKTV